MSEEIQNTPFGRKVASRRFIIVMLVIIMTPLLLASSLIDMETFKDIMIWMSGIYIIGKPMGDAVGIMFEKK